MSGSSQAPTGRPYGLVRQGRRSRRQLLRYSLAGPPTRSLRCSQPSLISGSLAAILKRTSLAGHYPPATGASGDLIERLPRPAPHLLRVARSPPPGDQLVALPKLHSPPQGV